MTRRSYSATAVPTSLPVGIGIADTSLVIADATGWPDGTGGPFIATIKRGQSGEEKILVTSRSGTTLSGLTRGYEGTTASTHASPETVEHTSSKTDLDEANAHINDTTRDDHTQYGLVKKTLLAARAAISHRSMQFWYGLDNDYFSVDDGTTWHDFPSKAVNDTLYLTPAAANAAYAPLGSTGAMTLIATSTALGNADFTSIPATYKDLMLIVQGRTNRASAEYDSERMTFNADTGTNYEFEAATWTAGAADTPSQALANTYIEVGTLPGVLSLANSAGSSRILIPNYANTSQHKTVMVDTTSHGTTAVRRGVYTGAWLSTAAINRIQMSHLGTPLTGYVISLYGVK